MSNSLRIAACRIPVLGELAVRGLNAFARAATTMATARGLSPEVRAGYLAPYGSWHDLNSPGSFRAVYADLKRSGRQGAAMPPPAVLFRLCASSEATCSTARARFHISRN